MEMFIGIILYIIITGGLYMIAKYMEEPMAILAFLPYYNIYIIIKLAGYGLGIFMLLNILVVLSGFVPIFIYLFLFLWFFILFNLGIRVSGNIILTIFTMFFPFIGFYIMGIIIKKKNKVKCNNNNNKINNKKKVKCLKCLKILLVDRKISNINGKCPKCGNIIYIK